MDSLDLSSLNACLNEVQANDNKTQQQDPNQTHIPTSSLLRDKDQLFEEVKQTNAKLQLDHKNKCKKCKKPEKSKGYYEKQDIKQKQLKKLKKGKK
ncbi:hypothetical protein TRFO_02905 [Tritrichomonas foetus]|uniref:Uncharacterized protein n=1 Tax=Tritrichomonas foetus TaxID=1144522 RepID=A0A1J4KWF1_9EUKA|nr:hypothetical protein TRFO_02905 [Tritrichomonas foetus]|eukprot:OHT15559.1 hypothetical protein TRFO_02905 [Tritrichomonas foetus]